MDQEIAITLEQRLLFGQSLLTLPVVDGGLEFDQAFGIAKCGHIADFATLDQSPHHPAHIFSAARFRKLGDFDEVGRHCDRALFGADKIEQPPSILMAELAPGDWHDEGKRGQPLFAVRRANHQHVANRRIGIERLIAQHRAFDLLGSHPVARDVDNVIAPSVKRIGTIVVTNREIALRIAPCAAPARPVSGFPARRVALPAANHAALLDTKIGDVAPDRPRQIRIGRCDDDLALLAGLSATPRHAAIVRARIRRVTLSRVRIFHPNIANDPWQRIGMGIGTQRKIIATIKMRPGDAAMLGCPVAVDIVRRHIRHAERLHRGRGWFGTECRNTQRRHVVTLKINEVRRIGHHGLQERHPRFEDRHLVPLNHRGEPPRVREHG